MLRLALCSLVLLWQTSTAVAQTSAWCAGVDKAQVGALLGGTAPAPKQAGPTLYLAVLGPGSDAAAQKPALLKLAQSLIGS